MRLILLRGGRKKFKDRGITHSLLLEEKKEEKEKKKTEDLVYYISFLITWISNE